MGSRSNLAHVSLSVQWLCPAKAASAHSRVILTWSPARFVLCCPVCVHVSDDVVLCCAALCVSTCIMMLCCFVLCCSVCVHVSDDVVLFCVVLLCVSTCLMLCCAALCVHVYYDVVLFCAALCVHVSDDVVLFCAALCVRMFCLWNMQQ